MPKLKNNTPTYWVYNMKSDNFYMDMPAAKVANMLHISSGHVSTYADNYTIVKDIWMIWHSVPNQTPAYFRQWFVLPSKIRKDTLDPIREYWGNKVYTAYWNKYRRPKQVVLLNEGGEELMAFDSYQECADHLGIPIGTVRSKLNRVMSIVRTNPIICKREDYQGVLDKYFNGNATSPPTSRTNSSSFSCNINLGWEDRSQNTKHCPTIWEGLKVQ